MSETSRPPQTLLEGRYLLDAVIGEGGMGAVYEATDVQTNQPVAVKLLNPASTDHPAWRSRFITEARTMSMLRHPHIARVFHVGEDQGQLYYVMERCEHGSVYDLLRAGVAPPGPLWPCRVVFEVLMGLSVAHERGILHRDIKPANLLVTRRGIALSDFGLARVTDGVANHRTRTGEALGTVGYMAPEQQSDARRVGPEADIYSAGATLFAMLSHKSPINLSAVDKNPAILDPVPEPLRAVVARAVSRSADDRYPNVRSMAEALAEAASRLASTWDQPPFADVWMREFDHKDDTVTLVDEDAHDYTDNESGEFDASSIWDETTSFHMSDIDPSRDLQIREPPELSAWERRSQLPMMALGFALTLIVVVGMGLWWASSAS